MSVCPRVFHVLGAKSVLRSVKFLLGLAHCLLRLWLGVLREVLLTQLGQEIGQQQLLLTLPCLSVQ